MSKNTLLIYIGGPLLILVSVGIAVSRGPVDFSGSQQILLSQGSESNIDSITSDPKQPATEKQASQQESSEPEEEAQDQSSNDAANWRLLQKLDYKTGKVPTQLEKIVDKKIRIPGYAVPLGNSFSQIKEFLLVPNQLACIHVPPPPPNLMINIKLKEPIERSQIYGPIWVTGELRLKTVESEYGPASWKMEQVSIEPYKF